MKVASTLTNPAAVPDRPVRWVNDTPTFDDTLRTHLWYPGDPGSPCKAVKLTDFPAPQRHTMSLTTVNEQVLRKSPDAAVMIHTRVPGKGQQELAAYAGRLQQLERVMDLETKVGRPLDVVVDLEKPDGTRSVDIAVRTPAPELYSGTLAAMRLLNTDGRFDGLLARYNEKT
ncbi:MAG TPA: hypothetical protein VIT92_08280 [Burkholderiaceae bacterium]